MRSGFNQDVRDLLSAYLGDVDYWCNTHDPDGINSVTAGTESFSTMEQAEAYRDSIFAVLGELENAMATYYKISILWGQCPEDGQKAITYKFKTKAELDAFELGISEMDGWLGYNNEVEEGHIHQESAQ